MFDRKVVLMSSALMLLVSGTSMAAADPVASCESSKSKGSGKLLACLLKANAGLAVDGDTMKHGEAVAKCTSKFTDGWEKSEDKATAASSQCADLDPEGNDVLASLTECAECAASQLDGGAGCECEFCPLGAPFVGGACWYLASAASSCEAACGSVGMAYSNLTASYAGSGAATFTHCDDVLSELGLPATTAGDSASCSFGSGCVYHTAFGRTRCTTPATAANAFETNAQRACACE